MYFWLDAKYLLIAAILDVCAVVKDVGDLATIQTKAGKSLPKRDLTLVDRSGVATKLTLWGKNAEEWTHYDSPVVAFKGVKVSDFGGRSLSMYSSSMMALNPDTVESHALRGWYDAVGANSSFASHQGGGGGGAAPGGPTSFNRAEFRSLNDVKESQLGMGDKADWFSARATVVHIKADPISYPACPTCNKKVNQTNDGWRCEKCDRSYEAPEHRYESLLRRRIPGLLTA
jgi:replication factor A1